MPINKKRRKQRFDRLHTSGFSSHPSYQNSQAYNKNCALSLKCIDKTLPKRPSWRETCTAFCLLPHTHITYLHYSINTSKASKSTSKQNKQKQTSDQSSASRQGTKAKMPFPECSRCTTEAPHSIPQRQGTKAQGPVPDCWTQSTAAVLGHHQILSHQRRNHKSTTRLTTATVLGGTEYHWMDWYTTTSSVSTGCAASMC